MSAVANAVVARRWLERPRIRARVPAWSIAARQRSQGAGRCENVNHKIARTRMRRGVSAGCPLQQRRAADDPGAAGLVRQGDNAAVGQAVERAPVPALGPPVEPLCVQHAIDLVRGHSRPAGERRRECPRVGAPALEAGPVTGRQRRRLIEEEQLGVAPAPNVSMPSLEVEAASNPPARDPAPSAEGLPVAMETAAAIAEQQAARSIGKQIAERIDAVGQRHCDSSCGRPISNAENLALRPVKDHAPAADRSPPWRWQRAFCIQGAAD